jgi:hypothetical protein
VFGSVSSTSKRSHSRASSCGGGCLEADMSVCSMVVGLNSEMVWKGYFNEIGESHVEFACPGLHRNLPPTHIDRKGREML